MNYDNYFQFFYFLNKNNLLEEKTKIFPVLKNKIISKNNYITKKKEINFYICEILLENNKILLIEDLPINFLLSHTIIIGENSELFEFNFENKTYIGTKKIIELFKGKNSELNLEINQNNKIDTKELYNLKFEFKFKLPNIIEELKKYLSKYKKINFNKIHIIQGDNIENFVPNAKSTHLKLAKEMNLPIINLIQDNYIKNTTINIYDEKKLNEILKPVLINKKEVKTKICKKNKLILYNDISTDFYIKIPRDFIFEKIENAQITNFDKEMIQNEIKNLNSIKISETFGKHLLPIWKSISNQKYLEIKNIKDFEGLSGMSFRQTTENFKDIYLQYKNGEQAVFKNKYFKNKYNFLIENLEAQENIEFLNIEDLILKLIFNEKTQIKNIIKTEQYDSHLLNKVDNNITYILDKIIKISIEKNSLPKKYNFESLLENYLKEVNNLITFIKETFERTKDKKYLITEMFKISNKIKFLSKNEKYLDENSYYILQITNNILNILENLKIQNIDEIKNSYLDYFKDYKFSYAKEPKINFEIIKIFEDIVETQKKENIKIYFKKKSENNENQNLEEDYIDENEIKKYIKNELILDVEPEHITFIKPNSYLLKKLFKYNYKQIIQQVKNIDYENIIDFKLNINNKQIPLKDEYLIKFYKYKDYKILSENKYFLILLQK